MVRHVLAAIRHGWTALGLAMLLLLLIEVVLGRIMPAVPEVPLDTYRPGFANESDEWLHDFGQEMAHTVSTFETTGVRWQPFSYWRNQPFDGQFVRVDHRGLRHTWQPPAGQGEQPPVRIFAFGGSALWGVGNRDDETIPSILAHQLYDQGVRAEVINFGQLGHVSSQELISLTNELRQGNVPKLVLFLDGYNDLCSSYLNERAGVSLDENERRREFRLLRHSSGDLFALGLANLRISRLLAGKSKPQPAADADSPGWQNFEDVARGTVAVYNNHVRVVRALEKEFGFRSLFCWQPIIYTKRRITPFELQQVTGRETQQQLCLTVYREASQAFSTNEKTPLGEPWGPPACFLIDVFDAPPWDNTTAFFDRCHLTEEANAAVVDRLLPTVLEKLRAGQDGATSLSTSN